MTDPKPIWDQLAELGAQIPPEAWAEIEADRSPGRIIEELRADRDSLRDALDALERVAWQLMVEHGQYTADDWRTLESARHVLGSKRA
jgi:Tfp pilus assembly protein PilN